MITHFRDKNHTSNKIYKNYKTLNTILESVDTIVFNGVTSTSLNLSNNGVGLNNLTLSARIACASLLLNKILQKIFIN